MSENGTPTYFVFTQPRKGRHYESRRDHCERGHPLFGDNMRIYPSNGSRHCRACMRGHQRLRKGWPEHLAFHAPPVGLGYTIDLKTGEIGSRKGEKRPRNRA